MNVRNRKCIRKLSFRTLWASRKRNLIAILAIVLTTLLFTSLFTIDLNVMLHSEINIEGQMAQVIEELGLPWETDESPKCSARYDYDADDEDDEDDY